MRKAALAGEKIQEEDAAEKNCTIMICQSVGPVETLETASKYEVGNGRKGVKIVKCEFISVIQKAISHHHHQPFGALYITITLQYSRDEHWEVCVSPEY